MRVFLKNFIKMVNIIISDCLGNLIHHHSIIFQQFSGTCDAIGSKIVGKGLIDPFGENASQIRCVDIQICSDF